jgi:acetyltransferase
MSAPPSLSSAENAPMTAGHLNRMLRPTSVAFVGASVNPAKVGGRRWLSMAAAGFPGPLYPVHPTANEIGGHPAYRSIGDLPGRIDLAVVAIRPDLVEGVVEACAARDVAGVVVITGGFGEQSPSGRELELRLRERLARIGARMIGPNCAGIFSAAARVNVTGMELPSGPVALLTQSGNVLLDAAHHARRTGIGFSHAISVGNAVDLRSPELLEFLLADSATRAIVIYLEGWLNGEARAFCDVVQKGTHKKPVILLQPGDTEAGRRAALSHTGSLAVESRIAEGAFAQSGILRAPTIDDAWRLAGALATMPCLQKPTICVASDGGGHATLACDALERDGLLAPVFDEELKASLRTMLPVRCPLSNPVDYAGLAEEEPAIVAETLDRCLADAGIGGALLAGHFGGYHRLAGPVVGPPEIAAAKRIGEIMWVHKKPIVVHSVYAEDSEPAVAAMRQAHVPVVRSIASATFLLRGMKDWAALAASARRRGSPTRPSVNATKAKEILAACSSNLLLEPDVYQLLASYGLPTPRSVVVRDPQSCAKAVRTLGKPAALKIVSGAIVHKSDVGGVILNVNRKEAAREFDRLLKVAAAAGDSQGAVLVTPMAGKGTEIVLGALKDPHFGPVVMIGIGGVLVEILRDVVFAMAPLDRDHALSMLERIKASALLNGYRGQPPVERQKLADCLVRLSHLIVDYPEISEVDINPAVCAADGVTILDARIVVSRSV